MKVVARINKTYLKDKGNGPTSYSKDQASLKVMISEIKVAGEAARNSEINYRRTGSRFYLVPGL